MRNRYNLLSSIDRLAMLLYVILVIIGWLSIYASVYDESHDNIFDINKNYGKQFLWILSATIIAGLLVIVDARFYANFAYLIYLFTILMLIGVLFFGKEIAGSKSWVEMAGYRFQPTEFAKYGTCLALAKFLSTLNINIKQFKTKFIGLILISIPAILTLLQGDAGSALVYTSLILVLYRFGLSGNILILVLLFSFLFIVALLINKLVIIGLLISIAAIFLFLIKNNKKYFKRNLAVTIVFLLISSAFIYSVDYGFNNILKLHQRTRINVMLGIEDDPFGAGYNVNQSKIAIGSGGFFGKGFLQGTQTKYDFVPEQSTDFIFCTIGEEQGFLGSILIIGMFLVLMLRIIYLSERQRSKFTMVYGYGVVSILFFHFAINIGMTIGLAPVIGIPFPFFSYGGSSLWAFTLLLLCFIKLDAHRLQEFR